MQRTRSPAILRDPRRNNVKQVAQLLDTEPVLMDVFQATPITEPIIEPDLELRTEIKYLVAQVGQWKGKLVKTEGRR